MNKSVRNNSFRGISYLEITVFTPTYNRAYVIKNLYESLKKQTFTDFEWIVIDDGSTDNTSDIFSEILSDENFFPITYKKVKNGGKHRAVNQGVQIAKGRLFFIVDSDDCLPSDSLETIIKYEKNIPESDKKFFSGVAGLRGRDKNNLIGKTFEGDFIDITHLERASHSIYGDKAESYYTEIIKRFPFPEFDGENFIMESVVWNEIGAAGLKLRYFNEVIYFCEYLEDGLTKQGTKKFESTPKGYGLYLYQSIKYGKLKKLKKWQTILDYYYMFSKKISFFEMARNLRMNPIKLYLRIMGMKIFYKLYNR